MCVVESSVVVCSGTKVDFVVVLVLGFVVVLVVGFDVVISVAVVVVVEVVVVLVVVVVVVVVVAVVVVPRFGRHHCAEAVAITNAASFITTIS